MLLLLCLTLWIPQVDPLKPPAWNLSEVDESLRPAFVQLQAGEYDAALEFLGERQKLRKSEKAPKDELERLSRLEKICKDLVAVGKAAQKGRGVQHLAGIRDVTNRYRKTFAFPLFWQIEKDYREHWVVEVQNFELDPIHLTQRPEIPLRPFDEWIPILQSNAEGSLLTMESEHVPQGLLAIRFLDTPEQRNRGVSIPSATPDWTQRKYLHLTARLDDPKNAILHLRVFPKGGMSNYYEIALGTWKGWKSFRLEHQKIGVIHRGNQHQELDWKEIEGVFIHTSGGLSNFSVDDLYLSN